MTRSVIYAFCAGMLWVSHWAQASVEVKAGEVITLPMPALEADARGVDYLIMELDGYDVSAFVEAGETELQLKLPAPLDSGTHQLVIMVFYQNGEVEPVMKETLVVSGSASHWIHAISLDNSYRSVSHEKSDFAEEDHYHSSGAVAAQGQIKTGKWELSTEIETLYDNNESNNTSGDEFDLGRYHLEARYQGDTHGGFIRVGDRFIEQESLLFSDYQRRGISSSVNSADGTYALTVFGVQSDTTTSAHSHLAYPTEQEERSSGGIFTVAPLQNKQALQISTGYIEGEGTGSGAGYQVLDESTIFGGETWNVRIDSRLFENALWLHAEYAESNFDSDGIDQGAGKEDDAAWSAGAEYSAAYNEDRWVFDQWTLGYIKQEVGALYWSMANLSLAGDLQQDRIYYQANLGGFGLSTEFVAENNNVDDDATKADLDSRFANVDLYYTPMNINSESGVWAVLGVPMFNAYAHLAKREQPESDVYLSGADIDDLTRDYSLSASFSKERWSWGVQHNQIYFDDHSSPVVQNFFTIYEPFSDSINYLTTLMVSYMPSERVRISPMVQWNVLEEATDSEYETTSFGFDGQFQIIPDRWFFNLNYSFNQNDNRYEDDFGIDSRLRDQTLHLQSTWRMLAAKGLSPGVDLYLKGSHGRQQELIVDDGEEIYQVLVGFTLYWNKEGH